MINTNRYTLDVLASSLIFLGTMLWGVTVSAQTGETSKDPTVPPATWLAAQPASPKSAAVVAGDAARVRVTVVGKQRRLAIVDGKVVQVGDVVADTRVAAILHDNVTLENEERSLSMTPNVEKRRPVRPVPKKVVSIPEDGKSSMQTGSK